MFVYIIGMLCFLSGIGLGIYIERKPCGVEARFKARDKLNSWMTTQGKIDPDDIIRWERQHS